MKRCARYLETPAESELFIPPARFISHLECDENEEKKRLTTSLSIDHDCEHAARSFDAEVLYALHWVRPIVSCGFLLNRTDHRFAIAVTPS